MLIASENGNSATVVDQQYKQQKSFIIPPEYYHQQHRRLSLTKPQLQHRRSISTLAEPQFQQHHQLRKDNNEQQQRRKSFEPQSHQHHHQHQYQHQQHPERPKIVIPQSLPQHFSPPQQQHPLPKSKTSARKFKTTKHELPESLRIGNGSSQCSLRPPLAKTRPNSCPPNSIPLDLNPVSPPPSSSSKYRASISQLGTVQTVTTDKDLVVGGDRNGGGYGYIPWRPGAILPLKPHSPPNTPPSSYSSYNLSSSPPRIIPSAAHDDDDDSIYLPSPYEKKPPSTPPRLFSHQSNIDYSNFYSPATPGLGMQELIQAEIEAIEETLQLAEFNRASVFNDDTESEDDDHEEKIEKDKLGDIIRRTLTFKDLVYDDDGEEVDEEVEEENVLNEYYTDDFDEVIGVYGMVKSGTVVRRTSSIETSCQVVQIA